MKMPHWGHRTHVGGCLAVLLPLALGWHWALALPVVMALWMTRSLTAWLASVLGLVMLFPWVMWLALPGAGLLIWHRQRFAVSSLDSGRARLLTWAYLLSHLCWLGHGTGSVRLGCEAAHLRSGSQAMDGGPARNELVQIVYEWGLPGLLVGGVFGWRLAAGLHVGEAMSAALVTGLVGAAGTSVLRTRWGFPWWGLALWRMV